MITSGGTIIAVDDEPALRELLKDILEKEGYQVFSAENGKLAMDVVDAHPPDLILLDLHMPVMNGFEFFRWLKTRDVYSNVPVIFLSASVEEDVRIDGLKWELSIILPKHAVARSCWRGYGSIWNYSMPVFCLSKIMKSCVRSIFNFNKPWIILKYCEG